MTKILFICHSSFAIELHRHILIFDYFKGDISKLISDTKKQIYFFASHSHADHFSSDILRYADKRECVHFVFSKDICDFEGYDITRLKHYEDVSVGELRIETLKSTDRGVAFMVECEGKKIYHAGDLNWWAWMDKGEEYVSHEGLIYRNQIDKIAGRSFDISFVPLDTRLGEGYSYGMDYFTDNVESDYIFPMHMWEKYEYIKKYKESSKKEIADKIMEITKDGECFEIKG